MENNYTNKENLTKKLDQAIIFAVHAHTNDKRKSTNIPYIVHPLEVLSIVSTMTTDENILSAAVLHDVVEDTSYTIEDIENKFGKMVATYVADESENKREDLPASQTWKIRKEESIAHFKTASIGAKMIALGDKLSNLRSMIRDYDKIGDELWQRFNQKDKNEHAWYYKSICEIISKDLSDQDACKEFQFLVKKLFG